MKRTASKGERDMFVRIDTRLLEEARKVLGTRTKKDTINQALARTVDIARQRDYFESLLGNPDARGRRFADLAKKAWG